MSKINKISEVKREYGDNYKVVYWATEEHRDMGESDIYQTNMSLEEAIKSAKKLVGEYAASAEVRVDNYESDLDDEVIFYCGPDERNENYVEEWQV
jgi:hypothetical protein